MDNIHPLGPDGAIPVKHPCLRCIPALVLGFMAATPAAPAQPAPDGLKAVFSKSQAVVPSGGGLTVELRIRNAGTADTPVAAAFASAVRGLKAETEDGKPLETVAAPADAKPAPGMSMPESLKGGQFVSYELDLVATFPGLAKPGRYRVTWSHPSFPQPPLLEVIAVEKYATIKTSLGEIVIEFHPDLAPKTVANFIALAKKGFYTNSTFHRVIPGFMMQGGCPKGNGTGDPGYTIKAEFNAKKHVAGTVSMARRADPDSAGCQFFICFAAASHLDNQYTAFASVVRGMDVVKKVEALGSSSGAPAQKIALEKVAVLDALPPEKP
jgi:peptidyl-prolyl cis-trans isomerase B (cyclophilin B)